MKKSKTILDFFSKSPSTLQSSSKEAEKNSSSGKKAEVFKTPSRSSNNRTSKSNPRSTIISTSPLSKDDTESKENINTSPIISKDRNHSNSDENGNSTSQDTPRKVMSEIESHDEESDTSKTNSFPGVVKKLKTSCCDEEDLNADISADSSAKLRKRRRIVIQSESEDSEDEYKPGKESESDGSLSEHSDASISESPPKKKKKIAYQTQPSPVFDAYKYSKDSSPSCSGLSTPKSASTPSSSISRIKSANSSYCSSPKTSRKSSDSYTENISFSCDKTNYLHERLDWLKPENIKDKCGRRKLHPDYSPETLFVPESFKKTLTPGLKQWWDIKSDHFDTVLFFKVGKFYEFYHMDAVVGVKELDLSYMKGDFAHSGFPEVAFGKFSNILIKKGYKVARIEQTETPQMMEQRCKSMNHPTKYDRVVKREICQVTSKGTRTLSYDEWSNNIGSQDNLLLAICEKHMEQDSTTSEYGICFVDTTIGKFMLGQFSDDRHQSKLLSFIALHPPVEILFEKSSVSQRTLKVFDSNLIGVSKQPLTSSSFWDATKTLKFMSDSGYFNGKEGDIQWPDAIVQLLDKDDRLFQTPLKGSELAFKALGACIWYLKRCFIEDCLLTMKLFEIYKPTVETPVSRKEINNLCKYMILDNVTLNNLAIVSTQPFVKTEETLYGTLNYCETSFGKRELRKWLCSPLFQPCDIYDRLDAIDDLRGIPIFEEVRKRLGKLPDLERLLNKIHVHGLARSKDHPETRAIFYEMDIYNKKKISDLLSALDGFKEAVNISELFDSYISSFKSKLLKKCVSTLPEVGCFPSMSDTLSFFSNAFDHQEALKRGSIIPHHGVDENYDSACKEIQDTLEELDSYRIQQSKKLGCPIKFVNVGKNRFLMELPENKKFPSDFEFLGGRKGFKRFYTKDIKDLLSTLCAAEETRDSALRQTTRCIFEQFDKHYKKWQKAVHCLSSLDVLLSLTYYCKASDEKMCRPVFQSLHDNSKPYLKIVNGRHPTFVKMYTGKDYIPNSVYIGEKDSKECQEDSSSEKFPDDLCDSNNGGMVVLVTGPNMGGKSTLMRQTGTLLVMAHLGCYVPAETMSLTPVDRIFTRVGANDFIYKGESTFFVESSETASILHHATQNSFVIIDELGRGTATYDGTAIAYSTANHLANDIGCRTLFSTHYHTLVDDFFDHPNVGLGHMACMVEEDNDCPTLEKVTFLYKFVNGACPKSYGFNVALLAGIGKEIVHKGFLKSQQMDYGAKISKCLRKLVKVLSAKEIIERFQDGLDACTE